MERIALAPRFFEMVAEGTKTTTIRYGHRDYKTGEGLFYCDICSREQQITITSVEYKTFGEISNEDALTDGYSNADELKTVLKEFYPEIHNNVEVTKVTFYV